MKSKIAEVKKFPVYSRVANLRKLFLQHMIDVKRNQITQGIIISRETPDSIIYDIAGMSHEEAISMLETVKFLILKEKWGNASVSNKESD